MDKKEVRYEKKKINVPLLIVLLVCAFVPGIIYLIWAMIPRKVVLNQTEPKTTGWLVRLLGSAISTANWIYMTVYILVEEDGESIGLFYLGVFFGLLALVPSILSKKPGKQYLIVITLLASICMLVYDLIFLGYGYVSLIGVIVTFVGCGLGSKYNKYLVSQQASASEETTSVEE